MERDALRLVVITDNLRDGVSGLLRRTAAAVRGGTTMVQLRLPDEGSRTLMKAARALAADLVVPVVIHCRLDVALASGAAGVHLGVHDLSVADARRLAGPGFVIGRSVGTAEDLARAEGAD